MHGMTITTHNVAALFQSIKEKIGDQKGLDIIFHGKPTKRGLLCYDWYSGKGRPRKEDYIPYTAALRHLQ